ncbi:AraC family transcriptional regulator [Sphingobacteriaceae bacterium]|nr:AraC family transcriptional regulator [Sphingobacteriaceae bacterium]
MKKQTLKPYLVDSISEWHRLLKLPAPEHPLISVVNFDETECYQGEELLTFLYNFYVLGIKKNCKGKIRYGQKPYDFDSGVMNFFSPGQLITSEQSSSERLSGIWLLIHPDFLRRYSLSKMIKGYGFFSYALNEALHLSDKEEKTVTSILLNIEQEYRSVIDTYSQDVIISHIELLLNYSNRFYNRQFITRKHASNDLLDNLEKLLADYFESDKVRSMGLPTVQFLSDQLHVSTHYLSDMLRSLTGQSTQHHIHNKLIEKAKETLTTTNLSVSEIAYQLGFEYPQSFSKLFKGKTNLSPMDFRNSFN